MSGKQLHVCGIPVPVCMDGQSFGVCTHTPNHKGDHGCMVDFTWPEGPIILGSSDPEQHKQIQDDPPVFMTFRIRAPHGDIQEPYIQSAMESAEESTP